MLISSTNLLPISSSLDIIPIYLHFVFCRCIVAAAVVVASLRVHLWSESDRDKVVRRAASHFVEISGDYIIEEDVFELVEAIMDEFE